MSIGDLSTSFGFWLLDWSIKASALFAAALCLERLFRRAQPEVMLALHRAVLATLIAGPLVMLFAKYYPVILGAETPLPNFEAVVPVSVSSFLTPSQSPRAFALITLAVVWLLGVLLSLSLYARSIAGLRRAFHTSAPLPTRLEPLVTRLQDRCGSTATVVMTRAVDTPCTFGLIRPVILLPADLQLAPDWQIEAVVTHELLHVRGRDTLWLLLGELICAFHWFNPLSWVCVRRHRQLMELKCDARSIGAGVPLPNYVRAIASTSRQLLVRRGAAAAMAADGVIARLHRLVDGRESKPLAATSRVVIAAVSGLFALFLGSASLTAGPAPFNPAVAQRMIDQGTKRLGPVKAGSARLYVLVPPGITLRAPMAGFMCSGIGCVTTVPARPELQLLAEAENGSELSWEGCAVSPNGKSCTVNLVKGSHFVQVTSR